MGLLDRIRNAFKSGSTKPDQWLVDWVRGGEKTTSGMAVTPESAMRTSAVWACVKVRSEDIGKVPCHLYKRLQGGGKDRATEHPLYSLVRDMPNPMQTAFEFRQLMQTWLDLRGNAYALKDYDGSGKLLALWPLNPQYVTVLCVKGTYELFYRINVPGSPQHTLPSEAVFHLRGMSLDGMTGLSPIAYHRETVGLAMAAAEYGAAFFGNSAQPQGALKIPSVLSPDAAGKLRSSWETTHKGSENARKLAILDGGIEWVQTAMDNTDAQYLETRNFQNREIWRLYRMPPHKVGDLDKATFSNIEQQSLEYVTDCLMTEAVRWEQTLARELLTEQERPVYFFEFLLDILLRGDFASRMNGYAIARNWGLMSADDCREKENMNPLPDKKGTVYLQPLNMIEVGTKPPEPPAAPPRKPRKHKVVINTRGEVFSRVAVEGLVKEVQDFQNGKGSIK